MNHQLSHIFDESTCLTKRQMADYISGAMSQEECHAAEVHIGSCPFCSDAVDGLMMNKDEAKQLLASLDPNFIKEHFHDIMPEVHLNSMAASSSPSSSSSSRRRHKHRSRSSTKKPEPVHYLWKIASIAALLAVIFGVVWYFDHGEMHYLQHQQVADNSLAAADSVAPGEAPAVLSPAEAEKVRNKAIADSIALAKSEDLYLDPYSGSGEKVETDGQPDNSSGYATTNNYTSYNRRDNGFSNAGSSTKYAAKENYYSGPVPAPGYNQSQAKARGNVADTAAATYAWQGNRPSYANSYNPEPVTRGYEANDDDNKDYKAVKKEDAKVKQAAAVPAATDANVTRTERKTSSNDAIAFKNLETAAVARKDAETLKARGKNADNLKQGNIEFDNKNYAEAIKHYSSEINSMNKRRRHEALLNSARCYILMGNKPYAKMMLQRLLDDTGGEKGEARSLMKQLEK